MPARRPVIGCTTYRKMANQDPPIEVYGIMPAYVEAIVAAGGIPMFIPLGLSEADLQVIFERIDGLLLPGGGDVEPGAYKGHWHAKIWGIDTDRDRIEFFMTRLAVEQQKPLLAICRGIQVFNVALGGTLWEDLPSQAPSRLLHDCYRTHPRNHLSHTVEVLADSLLARCLGRTTTWVNSLHHQAVRELAPNLLLTATAEDGVVEGVEVPGHPFAVGVQWHPECLIHDDPNMLALFKGLVEAAVRHRPAR